MNLTSKGYSPLVLFERVSFTVTLWSHIRWGSTSNLNQVCGCPTKVSHRSVLSPQMKLRLSRIMLKPYLLALTSPAGKGKGADGGVRLTAQPQAQFIGRRTARYISFRLFGRELYVVPTYYVVNPVDLSRLSPVECHSTAQQFKHVMYA
jgi:hypothetical protein